MGLLGRDGTSCSCWFLLGIFPKGNKTNGRSKFWGWSVNKGWDIWLGKIGNCGCSLPCTGEKEGPIGFLVGTIRGSSCGIIGCWIGTLGTNIGSTLGLGVIIGGWLMGNVCDVEDATVIGSCCEELLLCGCGCGWCDCDCCDCCDCCD